MLFKVHFQTAHAELLETQYLTLNDTTYNANMVEAIVNRVAETMNQQLQQTQHTPVPSLAESLNSWQPNSFDINSVTGASTGSHQSDISSLLPILQQITETLNNMNVNNNQNNSANQRPSNSSNQRPNRSRTHTGPRQGQPSADRPTPSWAIHYCWTHGQTGHKSDTCRSKAPGHQDAATATNKMGGSTYGYP